jgi:hypothetical protein
VVARFAVIKAQRVLAQVSDYLANPQRSDQGRDVSDLKEQVADVSTAVESIEVTALIPHKWDDVVPEAVCDILDRVESVVSLVHVRTSMQDNGVYADVEAQKVGALSRQIRGAKPGERITY